MKVDWASITDELRQNRRIFASPLPEQTLASSKTLPRAEQSKSLQSLKVSTTTTTFWRRKSWRWWWRQAAKRAESCLRSVSFRIHWPERHRGWRSVPSSWTSRRRSPVWKSAPDLLLFWWSMASQTTVLQFAAEQSSLWRQCYTTFLHRHWRCGKILFVPDKFLQSKVTAILTFSLSSSLSHFESSKIWKSPKCWPKKSNSAKV